MRSLFMKGRFAASASVRDDAGMTVLEVIIATAILGIVVAFVMTGFSAFQSSEATDDLKLQNLDEARLLMDTVSKDIRTAAYVQAGSPAFTTADATHVIFTANLLTTTNPNQVEIYIDTTDPNTPYLVEKIRTPDPNSCLTLCTYNGVAGSTTTTRFVGKYVTNNAGNPLFTYYDSNGAKIVPPVGQTALTCPAQCLQINSIKINLSVRKGTSRTIPSTTLVNTVTLPNLYYAVQPSPTPT
jgi:prepilin-type N-terminal cleavage/methylation domain-containing protein